MICVDTNCLIAYLAGDEGADIDFLDKLLARKVAALAPVVVAELLSDPSIPADAEAFIRTLPELAITEGYWVRSGKLRAQLNNKGSCPRLADTLIAQSCIDHGAPLLTRDKGFRKFATIGGLRLA